MDMAMATTCSVDGMLKKRLTILYVGLLERFNLRWQIFPAIDALQEVPFHQTTVEDTVVQV